MKENKVFAIMSGAFLLLFSLPVIAFEIIYLHTYSLDNQEFCLFILAIFLFASGLLLIFKKPVLSAVFMSLSAVAAVGYYLPEFNEYIGGSITQLGSKTAIPKYFAVSPFCYTVAIVLFALVLWLKGKTAFVLSVLSAFCQVIALILELKLFSYMVGHPTLFNILPVTLAFSVILSGIYKKALFNTVLTTEIMKNGEKV